VVREPGQEFADRALVLVDQGALLAAFFRAPEDVERPAAQPPQPRQHPEGLEHPRPVLALDQLALVVALREQRRREVEAQAEVAIELTPQLFLEATVGVET